MHSSIYPFHFFRSLISRMLKSHVNFVEAINRNQLPQLTRVISWAKLTVAFSNYSFGSDVQMYTVQVCYRLQSCMADFRLVPPFFIAFFSDFDGCVVCVAFCRV